MLVSNQFRLHRNRRHRHPGEAGYLLLILLLVVTLLVVASTAVAPQIKLQIERDREEEMIHRGVQYSRAIKRFYKKFGRFPNSVEELENTNSLRFLRRRYKDPITGKDFKLVHFGELRLFQQGIPGIPMPGLAGTPSTPGPAVTPPITFGRVNQSPGMMIENSGANGSPEATNYPQPQQQPGQQQGQEPNGIPGTDRGNADQQPQPSPAGAGFGSQVFGGGAILGVASTSSKHSIREFGKKNHYKDWQFIYDPSIDRGGMITGPAQPPLINNSGVGPGQQPAPGQGPGMVPQPPQQPPDIQQ
jgi:type II secretory pathway pseudopilin PulG